MLDMAFQLLAFFILHVQAGPDRGLYRPAHAAAASHDQARRHGQRPERGWRTDGSVGNADGHDQILGRRGHRHDPDRRGNAQAQNLAEFEQQLNTLLGGPGSNFEQVILQVGSGLHYDSLVRILDICSRVKLASGEQLTKLSITELPEGG